MKIVLSAILFYSAFTFAIRDNFRNIDGKNYYELLGVSQQANSATIKSAYRQKMKQHHTDTGGDKTMAQNINEANDALKNEDTRRRYDRWLITGQNTYADYGQRTKKAEAEQRQELRDSIVDIVHQALKKHSNLTMEQMADIAEQHILRQQRYFPMNNMTNDDLYRLFEDYGFNANLINSRKYAQRTLIALSAAALEILEERALYRSAHGQEAKDYLENAENQLTTWLNSHYYKERGFDRYADEIWKLWKKKSYFAPPPPAPANACSTYLTYTDEHGNTYKIPITIEIKIGR